MEIDNQDSASEAKFIAQTRAENKIVSDAADQHDGLLGSKEDVLKLLKTGLCNPEMLETVLKIFKPDKNSD